MLKLKSFPFCLLLYWICMHCTLTLVLFVLRMRPWVQACVCEAFYKNPTCPLHCPLLDDVPLRGSSDRGPQKTLKCMEWSEWLPPSPPPAEYLAGARDLNGSVVCSQDLSHVGISNWNLNSRNVPSELNACTLQGKMPQESTIYFTGHTTLHRGLCFTGVGHHVPKDTIVQMAQNVAQELLAGHNVPQSTKCHMTQCSTWQNTARHKYS